MNIVIAGSRVITEMKHLEEAIWEAEIIGGSMFDPSIDTVVLGGCPTGVDALGESWATQNGSPMVQFNWELYNRSWRAVNTEMAYLGHWLIAVWDGKSEGTLDMIQKMLAANKRVFIHTVSV